MSKKRIDYTRLNLELVARGVRRGWLADYTTIAELAKSAKGMPVVMYPVSVRKRPKIADAVLVLHERDASPIPKIMTHEKLALFLGLPCGSARAWEDPLLCFRIIVEAVPKGTCRDDHRLYVTSFWCNNLPDAMNWARAFREKATELERELLEPQGLKFLYRIDQPIDP